MRQSYLYLLLYHDAELFDNCLVIDGYWYINGMLMILCINYQR